MSFKSLLYIHLAEEPVDSLHAIVGLADSMNAHVDIVVLGIMPPPPASHYSSVPAGFWKENCDEVCKNTDARVAEVQDLIAKSDISANVTAEYQETGMIERAIGHYALCADVTLFSGGDIIASEHRNRVFGGALFGTGRPVLILGSGANALPQVNRTVIAWDGGLQAANALHAALPLLASSEEVRLTMIDPSEIRHGPNPGDDIAAYLARHGLNVSVDLLAGSGRSVSDVLLEHAADVDAGLLVMGGYGRSRIREWLLGGTTRDMLSGAELPILMAH